MVRIDLRIEIFIFLQKSEWILEFIDTQVVTGCILNSLSLLLLYRIKTLRAKERLMSLGSVHQVGDDLLQFYCKIWLFNEKAEANLRNKREQSKPR